MRQPWLCRARTLWLALLVATPVHASGTLRAHLEQHGSTTTFGNAVVAVHWQRHGDGIVRVVLDDRRAHVRVPVGAAFAIVLADGTRLMPSDMHLQSAPWTHALPVDAHAAREVAHVPGKFVEARFTALGGALGVDWRWVLRDGSRYLREVVTITALKNDARITRVELLRARADGAEVSGSVKGSPVVAGNDFFSFEHPLSDSEVRGNRIRMWIDRSLPLPKSASVSYSAVFGVARPGQMRRDFLAYIERERAHPYRTFLTYNSWYDIGYFTPYTEAQALDRIHAFGRELVRKRGVKMDSFLFDDGWDDRSGSWRFSKAFPHGFVPLRKAAAAYGAAPGVWLSPWGGYGRPKRQRVAGGKTSGYEVIDGGLALSGPHYYRRFHQVVMQLLKRDGINQFKFDGTGNANRVFPGSRFDSDFDAAIHLIRDIRKARPSTYINLTTGTYPSPFWLRYADSIWRGGEDDWHAGVGSAREQWITYRDEQTYRNIVLAGPLFPLNSLMLHGIIYAQKNPRLNTDPGHDFGNEVHSFFASGTQLQELYVTPSLLTAHDWDLLAEAAKWSRANASVLKDTHWIGGDPGRLDVYGWAAWTPAKAILTLRNPDDKPRLAVIDLARQLQLPKGSVRRFVGHSAWHADAGKPVLHLDADHPRTITLAPFQVLTLELTPVR